MLQRLSFALSGLRLPEPGRIVQTPGEDGLPVRAERRRPDSAFMLQGLSSALSGLRLPEPGRIVPTPGEDGLPIRTEGYKVPRWQQEKGARSPRMAPPAAKVRAYGLQNSIRVCGTWACPMDRQSLQSIQQSHVLGLSKLRSEGGSAPESGQFFIRVHLPARQCPQSLVGLRWDLFLSGPQDVDVDSAQKLVRPVSVTWDGPKPIVGLKRHVILRRSKNLDVGLWKNRPVHDPRAEQQHRDRDDGRPSAPVDRELFANPVAIEHLLVDAIAHSQVARTVRLQQSRELELGSWRRFRIIPNVALPQRGSVERQQLPLRMELPDSGLSDVAKVHVLGSPALGQEQSGDQRIDVRIELPPAFQTPLRDLGQDSLRESWLASGPVQNATKGVLLLFRRQWQFGREQGGFRFSEVRKLNGSADIEWGAGAISDELGRTRDAEQEERESIQHGLTAPKVVCQPNGREEVVAEVQIYGGVDLIDSNDPVMVSAPQKGLPNERDKPLSDWEPLVLIPPLAPVERHHMTAGFRGLDQ